MGPPEAWQRPEGASLAIGLHQKSLDSRATAKSPGAALLENVQQRLRFGLPAALIHRWLVTMHSKHYDVIIT